MMKLVLIRHGESEWNAKNLFTGWRDPALTEQGHAEAKKAGQLLAAKNMKFDIAFTSELQRAQVTCQHILDGVGQGVFQELAQSLAQQVCRYFHNQNAHYTRGKGVEYRPVLS